MGGGPNPRPPPTGDGDREHRTMSENNGDGIRTRTVEQPPIELVASIVHTDDGSRECTIYPNDVSDEIVTTTWLTAEEGSFVPLRRAR